MPLFCLNLLPRYSRNRESMECDSPSHTPAPPRPPRPSSAELDGLAAIIEQPLRGAVDQTHENNDTKQRSTAPSDHQAPLPLCFRRTRSSYRRNTLPKLPTIPDVSVEANLKTEVGGWLMQPSRNKGKGVDKQLPTGVEPQWQATQSSHYGSASTWPPRKGKRCNVVDDRMSIKEELKYLGDELSLTRVPMETQFLEQSQVPELQTLEHQPAGSLLLEWQDRFNRSSEDSGEPLSNASTLVPPNNNKFNLPPPPPDWVPPKSAWSDTTAASICERDGKGLRSRLRSLSLTRVLRRVLERSPSPSHDTDAQIAQILDDHDTKLSAVRAETHHMIVTKKIKRRRASEPGAEPKKRYQDVIEASANFRKRVLRRSIPDEEQLLQVGKDFREKPLEKERPTSLPITKAPKLKLNTAIIPWV